MSLYIKIEGDACALLHVILVKVVLLQKRMRGSEEKFRRGGRPLEQSFKAAARESSMYDSLLWFKMSPTWRTNNKPR